MRGRPFVFFGNPLKPFRDEICVKKCPVDNVNIFALSYDKDNIYCRNGYTGNKPRTDILYMGCTGDCPCFPGYSSTPILRRCIPAPGSETVTNSSDTTNIMDKINSTELSRQIMADINAAKYIILFLAGVAVVLSFCWLLLLKTFTGCLVWTTIILVSVLSITISTLLCMEAKEARDEHNDAKRKGVDTVESQLQYRTMTAFAVIATVATAVLLIVVLTMRNKIRLAIQIIKEAGAALTSMPCLFCVPIWTFVILGLFFAYWIATALYLATAGEPLYDPETGEFVTYKASKDVRRMQAYHVFALLWVLAFILGIHECTIAGSIATWYFSHDNKVKGFPILRSLKRTLRYHTGSVALGSLIIAIVQFIRVCIEYVRMQLKGKDNDFVRFLLRCLAYLFACLDRFLRFISRNAYIQIAIYGESFCTSAREAFALLMRNAWRLIAVQFIGDFVINLGKLVVVVIVAIVAFFMLRGKDELGLREGIELNYWAIPFILICVLAFAVCTAMMGLYELAIDTIFLCAMEDFERNDGSLDRPYYASEPLTKLLKDNEKRKMDTDLGKDNI
ncbi:solute carrier family 44 [Thecamonas trahens ATCC 50062]|uniref:Choline transporter-like protein n=1 Tax=Thecamonas trahens ATCC 50062 TaxID=461836 RepID=A0A0L0DCU2_THETB|nr:solute carrier family 44 [Thecamonas trahens ATCC 50062]KNC49936.1 solute carrier family 44 [Thecamonas trahens ATCC 50062]|eukprot:XP_013757414.1 solute carrier family 44 [Thecamonas trahens ATCC 50062]